MRVARRHKLRRDEVAPEDCAYRLAGPFRLDAGPSAGRFLQYSVRRIRLSVGRIRFATIFFKL